MSTEFNDLTTDAVPSPSRDTKNDSNQEPFDNEDVKLNSRNDTKHTSIKTFPRARFTQFKSTKVPTAQATVFNIVNSTHIQVGNQNHYYFDNKSEHRKKEKSNVKETTAIKSLKASEKIVETDDLSFVAAHIDSTWKDILRCLKYSEGQIEQFYLDNNQLGLKEVIYQSLLDWMRNEPTKATVGKLSQVLWDNDQKDVVKLWSEKE